MWSRAWAVLRRPMLFASIAGVIMLAYELTLPNTYSSELTVLSNAGKRATSRDAGIWAPSESEGPSVRPDEGPTVAYAEIIQSRWVIERVVQEEYDFTIPKGLFRKSETRHQTLMEYLKTPELDQAYLAFRRMMRVSLDIKSGMLRVRVETLSPELSQKVVNRAAYYLEDYLSELTRKIGDHKRAFTERNLAEAERQYRSLEGQLSGFLSRNRSVNLQDLKGGLHPGVDPVVQVTVEKIQGDLERQRQILNSLTLQLAQAHLEAQNDIPSLMILDQGYLPTVKSGPKRGFEVFVVAMVTFFVSLLVTQFAWVKAHILVKE
jgi:uncharacterized protein involved in exopolysaccharide biosynthesis